MQGLMSGVIAVLGVALMVDYVVDPGPPADRNSLQFAGLPERELPWADRIAPYASG